MKTNQKKPYLATTRKSGLNPEDDVSIRSDKILKRRRQSSSVSLWHFEIHTPQRRRQAWPRFSRSTSWINFMRLAEKTPLKDRGSPLVLSLTSSQKKPCCPSGQSSFKRADLAVLSLPSLVSKCLLAVSSSSTLVVATLNWNIKDATVILESNWINQTFGNQHQKNILKKSSK